MKRGEENSRRETKERETQTNIKFEKNLICKDLFKINHENNAILREISITWKSDDGEHISIRLIRLISNLIQ